MRDSFEKWILRRFCPYNISENTADKRYLKQKYDKSYSWHYKYWSIKYLSIGFQIQKFLRNEAKI